MIVFAGSIEHWQRDTLGWINALVNGESLPVEIERYNLWSVAKDHYNLTQTTNLTHTAFNTVASIRVKTS